LICVDDGVWVFWAVLLLILPLELVFSAFFAAAVHELFHIATIRLLGGKVYGIRMGIFGAVIESCALSRKKEFLAAMAGPVGSLSLLLFVHVLPVLGLFGFVQGLYNLIPVYPMDGGRIAHILLQYFYPNSFETLFFILQAFVFAVLLTAAIYGAVVLSLGWIPVVFSLLTIASASLRKKP
jgi:stage IV sporulation protein FB